MLSSLDHARRGLTQFARNLVFLGLEAAALVGSLAFLDSGARKFSLLERNAWDSTSRNHVIYAIFASWCLVSALAFIALRRDKQKELGKLSEVLLPILPLSLLPMLSCIDYWRARPLSFLLLLAAVACLVCEPCFRISFSNLDSSFAWAERATKKLRLRASLLPWAVVALAAVAYVAYSGYIGVLRHQRFVSGAFDLAIFDNMMWNALHGEPFRSSVMYNEGPGNSLAGHAEFAMLLFAPFYAIQPSSEALLWIQAAAVGGGALTLFLFASTQLGAWWAAAVSLLYLFYAPLHGGQFYDFHWLTLVTPFLFLEFYGIAVGRWRVVIPTTLLLWLLREDIAPGLVVIGLVLTLSGARSRIGAALALGSAAWFALVKFVIMPSVGTWFFADLYASLTTPNEKGYGSVVKTLLTNPGFVFQTMLTTPKFLYLLHILVPVALAPLRRPVLVALLVPGAFFTVLTNWPAAISIHFQYSAHFTAYVFAAVVLLLRFSRNASSDGRARASALLVTLYVCMLSHSATFGNVIAPRATVGSTEPMRLRLSDVERQRLVATERLAARIPNEASVIATTLESPHVSNRSKIYSFGHGRVTAEYAIIHPASFPLGSTRQDISGVFAAARYGLVAQEGSTTLWKRGFESKETVPALKKLRSQLLSR